jgi:hypothetical protein
MTPPEKPSDVFQTQYGWVQGSDGPLTGWNYIYDLNRYVWFPEPEEDAILVYGAGAPEVNGVYYYDVELDLWVQRGGKMVMGFTTKAGGMWYIGESETYRYYAGFDADSSSPLVVETWYNDRIESPKKPQLTEL